MKAKVLVVASLLAVAPAMTSFASGAQSSHGSLSFTDYTPDSSVLAARKALYVTTGRSDGAYCQGGRVPSAPQDVTSHQLKVSTRSVLQITAAANGAWGFEVDNSRNATLMGTATDGTSPVTSMTLRLRPGTYVVRACNLAGAPSAQAAYKLTAR